MEFLLQKIYGGINLKIIDFIICEDIRHEIGNKETFIGVFPNYIIALSKESDFKKPIIIKLAFMFRFLFEDKDPRPDFFKMEFITNGKTYPKIDEQPLKMASAVKLFNMLICIPNFPLISYGEIEIKTIFKKQNKIIKELKPDFNIVIQAPPEKS